MSFEPTGTLNYLVFRFWIPAVIVLALSIHQELREERDRTPREKPRFTARAAFGKLSALAFGVRTLMN